jgi:hypothetical protein
MKSGVNMNPLKQLGAVVSKPDYAKTLWDYSERELDNAS